MAALTLLCAGGVVAVIVAFRLTSSGSCNVQLLYTGLGNNGLPKQNGDRAGVRLAIEEHNAKRGACQVTVFENEHPQVGGAADSIRDAIAAHPDVIGVLTSGVGVAQPFFSETLNAHHISAIAAVAGHLSTPGGNVFSLQPSLEFLAQASVVYLQQASKMDKVDKILVIDEAIPFYEPYVAGLKNRLGSAYVGDTIKVGYRIQNAVDKVKSSGAKAVVYAGSNADLAGSTLKVLRTSGLTLPFVGLSVALDSPVFFRSADTNASGAVAIKAVPGAGTPEFRDAFGRRFGTEPNIESAPGYDAARMYLAGIDAGKRTGPALAAFVASYDRGGYRFDANGALVAEKAQISAFTASTTAFPEAGNRIPLS